MTNVTSRQETRRIALLLGCPRGRDGVPNDIANMGDCLRALGFEVKSPSGSSRAGLISALRHLLETVGSNDSVVLYYAGHGAIARFEGGLLDGDEPNRDWRYLVCSDHSYVGADAREPLSGFCGILEIELDYLARRIAAKVNDLTIVLDCCFAEALVRGASARSRSEGQRRVYLRPDDHPDLFEHVRLARAQPPIFDERDEPCILAASGSERYAYEMEVAPDTTQGVFTTALVRVLASHAGRAIPWDWVMREVTQRVFELRRAQADPYGQWPKLIGPHGRLTFSSKRVNVDGEMTFVLDSPQAGSFLTREGWVSAGALHGLAKGDRIRVFPAHASTHVIGRVKDVSPDLAQLVFDELTELSSGLRAVVEATDDRFLVSMPAELHAALSDSAWLAPARDADYRVDVQDQAVVLRDGQQRQLRCPRSRKATDIRALREDLEALARTARFLAAVANPPSSGPSIRWRARRLGLDGPEELLKSGALLRCGDELSFEFEPLDWSTRPLHINLLDIGVAGRLDLLNRRAPTGVEVRAPHVEVLYADHSRRRGFRLIWPDDVPKRAEGAEVWLHIIVSTRPLDLRPLLRESVRPQFQTTREFMEFNSVLPGELIWTHDALSFTLVP